MSQMQSGIGTLIVVILKAKHLPDKRAIGKQAPYTLVQFNGEKRRTKAIHRGGQHPEWDEEVRFTLHEDESNDIPVIEGLDAPPPPPKKNVPPGKRKIKGGHHMQLSVYADDPREPTIIGETKVDLTEVLTKGETDDWYTLNYKDRYSGEVYLEMTFYSHEIPEKKPKPKETKPRNYGGAGSFVAAGSPSSLSTPPDGRAGGISRVPSASASLNSLPSSLIPPSLRNSGVTGGMDLYVAPYEAGPDAQARPHSSSMSSVDSLASDFSEMGMNHHRRRESFPPAVSNHAQDYHYSPASNGYYDNNQGEGSSMYGYDQLQTPTGSSQYESFGYPAYDAPQPSNFTGRNRPRQSLPTSSGFLPISNTPAPSGFMPIPSQTPDPSGYSPHMQPVHEQATGYAPPFPSHTPAPMDYPPAGMQMVPASSSFYPQSSFGYSSYAPPPSASAPPQLYIPSHTPFRPPQSAPPQSYGSYGNSYPQQEYQMVHAPSHGHTPPPPGQSGPSTPTSARPLPQPGATHRQGSLPLPSSSGFMPMQSQPSGLNLPPPPPLQQAHTGSSLPLPPPPPLPSQSPHQYPLNIATPSNGLPLPPTPVQPGHSPSRSALPQPPQAPYSGQPSAFEAFPPSNSYHAQPAYPGPPPPLAHTFSAPPNGQHPFPGPPPRPPSSISQYMPPPPPIHSYST